MGTYWWDYAYGQHIGFVLEHLYFNQQALMNDAEDAPSRLIRGGFVRQVSMHQSPSNVVSLIVKLLGTFWLLSPSSLRAAHTGEA